MPASFFKRHFTLFIWTLRIIVGATFIFSGFAKAVDPWGFVLKMNEYLMDWGISEWVPRPLMFTAAAGLAMFEFTGGLMLALGCFRRIAVISLSLLMAVMLPLSLYIWLASPVADCGCFGDAWIIPNWATFVKNVVLCALLAVLLPSNAHVRGAVAPLHQWIAIASSVLYCLAISLLGYTVQPIVDFRPYKTGEALLPASDDVDVAFIYEKDGHRQKFTADDLPDDTWTFVERTEASSKPADERQLEIYDGNERVTDYVIEQQGPQMLLVINSPKFHGRARASLANIINDYISARGGSMIGLLPLRGEKLEEWRKIASPGFDTYTVDLTLLEELVRGDAALVYLRDGIVQWKRDLYSLPGDFTDPNMHLNPDAPAEDLSINILDEISPIDNGRVALILTSLLALILLLSALLPATPKKRNQ